MGTSPARDIKSVMKSRSAPFWFWAAIAVPQQIVVCPECEIKSVSEAVSKASAGSTITVRKGLYREFMILIDKPLTLSGEPGAVLDAEGRGHVIKIFNAPGVTIRGLTLTGSGMSYIEERSGVRVVQSPDCHIEGNRFKNDTFGVYLEKTDHCTINDNSFEGTQKGESDSGNGVHVWYGSDHVIRDNRISGHRDGVYFEFVSRTQVIHNKVTGNSRYGLHFMSSHQNKYESNNFSSNGAGVAVMYSHEINMTGNYFGKNTGPAAYGLLLKEIHSGKIQDNFFENNTSAIYMEGSNRSKFTHNRIRQNGWGLRIMADCESNVFQDNDFVENTFDVTTNGSHSFNDFDGNYWSQYDGYDLNRDGKGDKPFRPVSLSSIMLERVDSSYVLIKSFMFNLLDEIERALPVLIPEALKDEHPLMKTVTQDLKVSFPR